MQGPWGSLGLTVLQGPGGGRGLKQKKGGKGSERSPEGEGQTLVALCTWSVWALSRVCCQSQGPWGLLTMPTLAGGSVGGQRRQMTQATLVVIRRMAFASLGWEGRGQKQDTAALGTSTQHGPTCVPGGRPCPPPQGAGAVWCDHCPLAAARDL